MGDSAARIIVFHFQITFKCNFDSFFDPVFTHRSHLAAACKALSLNPDFNNLTVELKSSTTKNINVVDVIVASRSAWFNKEMKHISLDR